MNSSRISKKGRKRWRPTLVVAGLLGCLLLHACQNRGEHASLIPVRIMVGRTTAFLPVLLAQRLGLYGQQGLAVSIEDTTSGATKSTQALLGGSAEVAGGLYEQTLSTAVEGQIVTSFVTLMRGDFRALVVSQGKTNQIRRVEDLKGAVIGVSAMGSPNQFFVTSIVQRHGLSQRDVSIVAVGIFTAAIAALERNRVDAAVLAGSAINLYQKRHPEARVLVDARTPQGMQEAFGVDPYATTVLYSTPKWLAQNKETAGRLARAIRCCLEWLQEHSPEEIAQNLPELLRTEPDADREAIKMMKPNFSSDGSMSLELASAVKQAFTAVPENSRTRDVDLSQTFTNEFVTSH